MRIRFPDRAVDEPFEVAELVEELVAAGLASLAQVEVGVDEAAIWVSADEKRRKPSGGTETVASAGSSDPYTAVGAVRRSLVHTDERFADVWRSRNDAGALLSSAGESL